MIYVATNGLLGLGLLMQLWAVAVFTSKITEGAEFIDFGLALWSLVAYAWMSLCGYPLRRHDPASQPYCVGVTLIAWGGAALLAFVNGAALDALSGIAFMSIPLGQAAGASVIALLCLGRVRFAGAGAADSAGGGEHR